MLELFVMYIKGRCYGQL